MNAEEARTKAKSKLKGPVIQPWLDYLDLVISSACDEGRFSIAHPFQDRRRDVGQSCPSYPTTEMQEAIKAAITAKGFQWKDHPDPDPGHPGSAPYSEILW